MRSSTVTSMPGNSNTRWWSKWEVQKAMMVGFYDIQKVLVEDENVGPMSQQRNSWLFFTDKQKRSLL